MQGTVFSRKKRILKVGFFLVVLLIGLRLFLPERRFVNRFEKGKEATILVVYDRGVPIWSEADLGRQGWPNTYTFFFGGKNLLEIGVDRNRQIVGSAVTFYDKAGKDKVMYGDHTGSGEITDRIVYDGDQPYKEILLPNSWRKLEKRGSLLGVMIDGQWHAVGYTNGVWSVRAESASR